MADASHSKTVLHVSARRPGSDWESCHDFELETIITRMAFKILNREKRDRV